MQEILHVLCNLRLQGCIEVMSRIKAIIAKHCSLCNKVPTVKQNKFLFIRVWLYYKNKRCFYNQWLVTLRFRISPSLLKFRSLDLSFVKLQLQCSSLFKSEPVSMTVSIISESHSCLWSTKITLHYVLGVDCWYHPFRIIAVLMSPTLFELSCHTLFLSLLFHTSLGVKWHVIRHFLI